MIMIRMRGRLARAFPFLIVLAVGVWLWHVANGFVAARPGYAGPDLWPKAVLLLLIAAALVGALQALMRDVDDGTASALIESASRAVGREGELEADLQLEFGDPAKRQPLWAWVGIALLLGFVLIVPWVGFTLATFLVMLGIMLAAGYPRLGVAVATSAVGAFAFFFVFQRIVYVSLPLGAGPFKELSIALMAAIGVR
jgi:putative tricarboxylic transport membrane protein